MNWMKFLLGYGSNLIFDYHFGQTNHDVKSAILSKPVTCRNLWSTQTIHKSPWNWPAWDPCRWQLLPNLKTRYIGNSINPNCTRCVSFHDEVCPSSALLSKIWAKEIKDTLQQLSMAQKIHIEGKLLKIYAMRYCNRGPEKAALQSIGLKKSRKDAWAWRMKSGLREVRFGQRRHPRCAQIIRSL